MIEPTEEIGIAFTENKGQWDERVKFRTGVGGVTVWFACDGIYYQLTRPIPGENAPFDQVVCAPNDAFVARSDNIEHLVIKATFVGVNPDMEIVGQRQMPVVCNYFSGSDPSRWRTGVANFEEIAYHELWPGVDLHCYGSEEGQLLCRYSITDWADTNSIDLEYEGVASISLDEAGRVCGQTEWGRIAGLIAPAHRVQETVVGKPAFRQTEVSSWAVSADVTEQMVSRAQELVYSTYLGGGGWEHGSAIAVDSLGSVYVAGLTSSADFPVLNPYADAHQGGECDVFITRFSGSGSDLVSSTYLGGSGDDWALGLAIDESGCAYVTGGTESPDFPTANAYDNSLGGDRDAFVAKLSSEGDVLVYSTFLGGLDLDESRDIAINSAGCAYVTGTTRSIDFPTQGAYDDTHNGGMWDVFVSKLSSDGSSLVYSTYIGGSDADDGQAITVDAFDCAYATGGVMSSDFPVVNAYDSNLGGVHDFFVTKLSAEGNSLVYSTYVGGSDWDEAFGIVVDGFGRACLAGWTYSSDFPISNAYDDTYNGNWDAHMTKLSAEGDSLVYGTFLGGVGNDEANDIAMDRFGCAYVTGVTKSADFPTQDAYDDSHNGNWDVFVTNFSVEGDSLVFSTFIGGTDSDDAFGIAIDRFGCAYMTGKVSSPDFPTQHAYDGVLGGNSDAFVAKLCGLHYFLCGDVDLSGGVDIDDVVYAISYIFSGGPEPLPYQSGDADCSGAVDIDDVVWLIAYIFSGGNEPCDTTGDDIPDCS